MKEPILKVHVFYEVLRTEKKKSKPNEWTILNYKTRIKIGTLEIDDALNKTRAVKLFETINYYCNSHMGYEPFEFENENG